MSKKTELELTKEVDIADRGSRIEKFVTDVLTHSPSSSTPSHSSPEPLIKPTHQHHLKPDLSPVDVYTSSPDLPSSKVKLSLGYTLGMPIGHGSFGVVYRAYYDRTKRTKPGGPPKKKVAMKVIRIDADRRDKKMDLNELAHELFTLEKLDHDHLVKLYEHFMIDDRIFISMELMACSMYDYLKKERKPFHEQVARHFFKQVCDAVLFMHHQGFAHRDLKLHNLLINKKSPRAICKVADFGLSRIYFKDGEVQHSDSAAGTVMFMPPEAIAIRRAKTERRAVVPYNTFKADIWSLGIILYALLNQAFPFDEEKPDFYESMMLRRWQMGKLARRKSSEGLMSLLNAILEPNPNKRITFYGIYRHYWMKSI